MNNLLDALAMSGLALVSVGLWTLRVSLTARDRKRVAAITAGVEAVVFALVFSEVLATLDAPSRLVGYALGVALGALLGMHASDRLSRGQSELRLVVSCDGDDLACRLRRRGWPATALRAEGATGPATVLFVAVDDRRLAALVGDLESLAPDAFWTVEPLRSMRAAAGAAGPVGSVGSVGSRPASPASAKPAPVC